MDVIPTTSETNMKKQRWKKLANHSLLRSVKESKSSIGGNKDGARYETCFVAAWA